VVPVLERIQGGEVLLADGAMGTLLMERGLPAGACPESINLERPELLVEIARLYLEAGAEIIQTNTLGASPIKLAMYGLAERTEDINVAAAQAVRQAVGNQAYVYGSCGPCGLTLQPYGDGDPDDVRAAFVRQIRALVDGGIDVLIVETMMDLIECRLAIEAARVVSGTLPVMACMTFDRTPRGFYTIMGNNVSSVAVGMAVAGADVIGSNCGSGIEQMIELARAFAAATARPLIFQPNAGLPYTEGLRAVYRETPEFMAERVGSLIDAGTAVIGGCCGTTPEHIRAMRAVLDARRT
jgi:5-methyltetrahydrofolate--homocysteine methyltransferase